jgi:hypothetical protein
MEDIIGKLSLVAASEMHDLHGPDMNAWGQQLLFSACQHLGHVHIYQNCRFPVIHRLKKSTTVSFTSLASLHNSSFSDVDSETFKSHAVMQQAITGSSRLSSCYLNFLKAP